MWKGTVTFIFYPENLHNLLVSLVSLQSCMTYFLPRDTKKGFCITFWSLFCMKSQWTRTEASKRTQKPHSTLSKIKVPKRVFHSDAMEESFLVPQKIFQWTILERTIFWRFAFIMIGQCRVDRKRDGGGIGNSPRAEIRTWDACNTYDGALPTI